MDLRQTKEYANFLVQIGWIVEKKNGINFFIKKVPIFGSAIKLQRTRNFPLKTLEELAKKHRAFQIIIEPEVSAQSSQLTKQDFKISHSPYLPTKTLQLDINKSNEKIIEQMKKDGRYSLRKSDGLKVREEISIEKFRRDWKKVVGNKRHVLPLSKLKAFKKAFGKNMILLTWKRAGLPAEALAEAGGMFLVGGGIAYYWIGYTSDKARDTLVQYQIIWNGILWAKKRKAKVFDFEGIYDERFPVKGWQGFTHFKKSFGGYEVTYPGSFTKWRLPF